MTRDYICNGCRLNLIKTWCQKWLPFKRPERNCIVSVLFLFREASELEIKVFWSFFNNVYNMSTIPIAKPPEPLNLEDAAHRGDNWKHFKRDWKYYETASKIDKKEGPVRVAHLFNVIGRGGQEMFETFSLSDGDRGDIKKVLQEFEARCAPVTHVIYE